LPGSQIFSKRQLSAEKAISGLRKHGNGRKNKFRRTTKINRSGLRSGSRSLYPSCIPRTNYIREVPGLYIRINELDFLLHHVGTLKALIMELKRQMERIRHEKEVDYIYDLAVKRHIDAMPHSGRITDRTAKAAANLGQSSREWLAAIREIMVEINLIGTILDRLELAKRLLRPVEREIIYLRYDKELTFQQMAANTGMSKERIKQSYGQALERMSQTCGVNIEEYEKVLGILERMGFEWKM
jgi:DNA-directed RNA polymerase specialized sigma24 family protein